MPASTPLALKSDLRRAGVDISDIWELVNSKKQYRQSIPILIDWLIHLDERTGASGRGRLREALVRCLAVPAARPTAAPVLIQLFRDVDDDTGMGIRWAIGNTLGVVADDSVFDEIQDIVQDKRFGQARQMVVLGLGRFKDPRVVPLLLEQLTDDDVAPHALKALAKLKPQGVRESVEPLLQHSRPLIRKEAKNTLSKLPT